MSEKFIQPSPSESSGDRTKVGLALGGGAVRGMAHLGVLSVLAEANISIDFMAGTSVGSLISVCYCAGLSIAQLMVYAEQFHWQRIARPSFSGRGLVHFNRLSSWIVQELGDIEFNDLNIPCCVIATDMEQGMPVALCEGRVAPAVQASCSVPGFVTPVELDGRILCDGVISDNLPVSILRRMGADYVIAVDIFSFKLRRNLGLLGYLLAALEILLERAGGGIDEADCLISPDLEGETYVRFSKRDRLFELGRQAAYDKVTNILNAITQTAGKVNLFSESG